MTMEAGAERTAVVGIVVADRVAGASRVNAILSDFGALVAGRLGMPAQDRQSGIIALIVQGTADEISALTGRLGNVPGVKVRSAIII